MAKSGYVSTVPMDPKKRAALNAVSEYGRLPMS